MSRRVKTEVLEHETPRVSDTPTRSSSVNYQEQINKLTEAVDRNTKEMQDLRMLIHTIGKNQELESASLQMRCNGIQAQFDNMMRMMCNGGVPLPGMPAMNANMGPYPMPEVSRVRHYSSSSINAAVPTEQPPSRNQKPNPPQPPPADPPRSPSPDIMIIPAPSPKKKKRKMTQHPTVTSSGDMVKEEPREVSRQSSPIPRKHEVKSSAKSSVKKDSAREMEAERVFQRRPETPPMDRSQEVETPNCIFCNVSKHPPKACNIYKHPTERQKVARKKHMCLKCLGITKNVERHQNCPLSEEKCDNCKKHTHSAMFCEKPNKNEYDLKKCEFCKSPRHNTYECENYFIETTAQERKHRMKVENRCFQCLKYNDMDRRTHTNCPNVNHVCQLCFPEHNDKGNAAHHPILCEYFHDGQHVEPPKKVKVIRSNQRS